MLPNNTTIIHQVCSSLGTVNHMTLFNDNNSCYCPIAACPLQAFWHHWLIYCDLHGPYFSIKRAHAWLQTGWCFSAAVWSETGAWPCSQPRPLEEDQLFFWTYFGSGFICQTQNGVHHDQNFSFSPQRFLDRFWYPVVYPGTLKNQYHQC